MGFDQKEAILYHTFCQSVLEKSSVPVQFIPLNIENLNFYKENHKDGSNKFIYSRFLTPFICDFQGMAIYADSDMIVQTDIVELQKLFDPTKAVQVVKHDYQTKKNIKYLKNINVNYPRKNWSSLIMFNCLHPSNRILSPDFIQSHDGPYLHRFSWLKDDEIGELPKEWNWLSVEYNPNPDAKLIHYTLGAPIFQEYKKTDMADYWWSTFQRTLTGLEE